LAELGARPKTHSKASHRILFHLEQILAWRSGRGFAGGYLNCNCTHRDVAEEESLKKIRQNIGY